MVSNIYTGLSRGRRTQRQTGLFGLPGGNQGGGGGGLTGGNNEGRTDGYDTRYDFGRGGKGLGSLVDPWLQGVMGMFKDYLPQLKGAMQVYSGDTRQADIERFGRTARENFGGDASRVGYLIPGAGSGITEGARVEAMNRAATATSDYANERYDPTNQADEMMKGIQMLLGIGGNSTDIMSRLKGLTEKGGQPSQGNPLAGILGSILGAGAGPGGFLSKLFSDRILKTNIRRTGTHPLGIGWYSYSIGGKESQGVMADEVLLVRPEAVSLHPNGYLMVDYSKL